MGYSIFHQTMADLTWKEVEALDKTETIVLFPLGVIEEHGPHLPLGTDCYSSYHTAVCVKTLLEEQGHKCLIVPPVYWGINRVTGAFPGSFTVKPETWKALLCDLFDCLQRWGFQHVYCFNCHGDRLHIHTILEAIHNTRRQSGLNVKLVMEGYALSIYGLTEEEEALLAVFPAMEQEMMDEMGEENRFDIHAGAYETAIMKEFFPDLTDASLAVELPDTSLLEGQLPIWNEGGAAVKELLPLGYAGNPAGYQQIGEIGKLEVYLNGFSAEAIRKDVNKDSKPGDSVTTG